MTAAAAHNSGLGQVNLNYLQTGGDFPFINHVKTAQNWSLAVGGQPDPDWLNSDGYPIFIPSGDSYYNRFFIPSKHSRGGRYLLRWTGNGTVSIGMSATYVSDSASAGVTVDGFMNSRYTSTTGSGRVVLTDVPESCNIFIQSAGISGLEFIHEDDEAIYDGGEIFGVAFKAAIAEGHISVIRFLNWTDTNLTTASDWNSRKPISYVSYAAHEFRGTHYKATTGTGTAYAMAAPSGWTGLADKVWVIARFHTDGTGHATLNVAGSGDKPLLNWACSPLDPASYPKLGGLGHCFYDGNLDAWIKVGGGNNAAHGNFGLNNGCPWEIMLRLCAETGTHPHFCLPHYSQTPPTDLTAELAAYCEANAPAWMCPAYEPVNEVWNDAFGFNQTYYARAVATALGFGSVTYHDRWYGYALSCLGQDVAAAYGVAKANVKTQTKYRVVGGIKTGGDLSVDGQQAERFESTDYIDPGFTPPTGYAQDPAKEWATDIAPANYFSPPIWVAIGGAVEVSMAAEFDGVRATVSINGTTMTIAPNAGAVANCTISNASPGVITYTNSFAANEPVIFYPTTVDDVLGVLPTQIVEGTTYYTSGTGLSGSALSVSAAPGGARINTTGGSGTVLIKRVLSITGKMQAGVYLRGVGIASVMVQPGTKIISGSGATWTLDKSHGVINDIGVIGGLDWSIVDDYAEHIYDAGGFGLPGLFQLYAAIKTFALAHDMDKACGYEGGWSPDLSGFSTDLVNCLRSAASYSDKIAKITLQAYEGFYALTDDGFTARYGSNYLLAGSIYPDPNMGVIAYGSVWAVLQDVYQNPRPPAWIAMRLVNKGDYTSLAVNN